MSQHSMNRRHFMQWLNNPGLLNSDTVDGLSQLISDYPYFQSARMLFAINLMALNDYRIESELRRCAAYAADRSRLKSWIMGVKDIMPAAEVEAGVQVKIRDTAPGTKDEPRLKSLEEQIKASLDQIERNKLRLMELLAEKKAIVGNDSPEVELPAYKVSDPAMRSLPKDALLEEYLQNKVDNRKEKAPFFSPEEAARRSIEENDGILSETLARLVAAQGKKDKAIKIYQELMLKNPQKSSYFAAQIEKLKNQP